eukprot:Rmarinus@m.28083
MRLLTHNMLASPVKGANNAFPLKLVCEKKEVMEADFDAEMVKHLLSRVEYDALRATVESIGEGPLPVWDDGLKENEDFLRQMHHILLEIHVIEGELECPASGRKFKISDGIPNMLINEEEV